MKNFQKIVKMDTFNLFSHPMWLFYNMGFTLLLVLCLGFLTSGSYAEASTSYKYYSITLLIYAALNTGTIAANSFMEERIKNPNMRILYSPIIPFHIPLSKIIASFIFGVICHVLDALILHFMLGADFGHTPMRILAMFFLLSCIELFAAVLGVMLCCLFKSEGAANQILSLALTLLAVLGGIFFQIEGFGKVFSILSAFSPVKWIVLTAFQMVYDANDALFFKTCILLLGLSFVGLLLVKKTYHGEDYLL